MDVSSSSGSETASDLGQEGVAFVDIKQKRSPNTEPRLHGDSSSAENEVGHGEFESFRLSGGGKSLKSDGRHSTANKAINWESLRTFPRLPRNNRIVLKDLLKRGGGGHSAKYHSAISDPAFKDWAKTDAGRLTLAGMKLTPPSVCRYHPRVFLALLQLGVKVPPKEEDCCPKCVIQPLHAAAVIVAAPVAIIAAISFIVGMVLSFQQGAASRIGFISMTVTQGVVFAVVLLTFVVVSLVYGMKEKSGSSSSVELRLRIPLIALIHKRTKFVQYFFSWNADAQFILMKEILLADCGRFFPRDDDEDRDAPNICTYRQCHILLTAIRDNLQEVRDVWKWSLFQPQTLIRRIQKSYTQKVLKRRGDPQKACKKHKIQGCSKCVESDFYDYAPPAHQEVIVRDEYSDEEEGG